MPASTAGLGPRFLESGDFARIYESDPMNKFTFRSGSAGNPSRLREQYHLVRTWTDRRTDAPLWKIRQASGELEKEGGKKRAADDAGVIPLP